MSTEKNTYQSPDQITEESVDKSPFNDPIAYSTPEAVGEAQELTPEQRRGMIITVIVFLVIIAGVIGSIVYLANQPSEKVALIRDIFIIWMAFMSLLIGLALVILMVQLARLINLLQNEIKPILDSTNETVSHLRGTTVFLSDNLAEPVIKLNEYLAGITQFFQVTGISRKKRSGNKNTKGE